MSLILPTRLSYETERLHEILAIDYIEYKMDRFSKKVDFESHVHPALKEQLSQVKTRLDELKIIIHSWETLKDLGRIRGFPSDEVRKLYDKKNKIINALENLEPQLSFLSAQNNIPGTSTSGSIAGSPSLSVSFS